LAERRVADARERVREAILAEMQAHELLCFGGWRERQEEEKKRSPPPPSRS
jgi:hypothetical protein